MDISSREIAFLALIESRNNFIEDFFRGEGENKYLSINKKDIALAKHIAYGTIRKKITIEYIIKSISQKLQVKINLKRKERKLLYAAVYQMYFMEKMPSYAIIDETVSIAKKYFKEKKAKFFNFFLREMERNKINLPPENLSIYHSFPPFFIEKLLIYYDEKTAKDVLESSNAFYSPWVRIRDIAEENKYISTGRLYAKQMEERIEYYSNDKNYYIQNITPITLIDELTKDIINPKNILDLCAAPGGKSLALMDLYPDSAYTMNDISNKKLLLIEENLNKYGKKAQLSMHKAENFAVEKKNTLLYDLVVLDAPCSNSGVFSKRHEARHRFTKESLNEHVSLQEKMISNAIDLLGDNGYLIYVTCSIINDENENLINKILKNNDDKISFIKDKKILPNHIGYDGGYGALLQKRSVF